jgi:peptidoglycan/xylan/chitin deacetylase (PgdA/CDA1 family)
MNHKIKIYFIFVFIAFSSSVFSQKIDSSYEVGTWLGFRSSAVSYTFDDGTSNQFAIVIPMFNEFDYKATFFTVIDWSSANWAALQSAANNGHEIASHTLSHPHLGTLTVEQQTSEEKNSLEQINSRITGQKCLTLAYPYCETGNINICKQYYIAARICSGSIVPKSPTDFYNISSIICGTEGSIKTAQDFNNKVNSAVNSKGWVVYLIHGIDNDGGWSPVTNENLRGSLEYLDTNRDKFWVATFVNVVCYIKERNNVSVQETILNDTAYTCQVTDTLDNEIYNYPVTLRRLLPDNWLSADISQNGKTINSQIVEFNSKKYVMFDVVPDNGDVQIVKSTSTGVLLNDNIKLLKPDLLQNYPNPFNPTTKIKYTIPDGGTSFMKFTQLKVYDILGNEVSTLVNEKQSPGYHEVEFNGNRLPSGIYFYSMQVGSFTSTKKLVLMK